MIIIQKYQMDEMLSKNERLLVSIARLFYRKSESGIYDFEDLMQEARMAFIEFYSQHPDCEEPSSSYFFIKRALYKYVRTNKVVHVSRRSFEKMTAEEKTDLFCSYDEESQNEGVEEQSGDLSSIVFINDFLSRLDPMQKRIVSLKVAGYKRKEIARMIGDSFQSVKKRNEKISKFLRNELTDIA